MEIGSQIMRRRKQMGMTQEELGRAVGVTTQAVSRWENGGAPDVALLPAIADALHLTIDALFGREVGEAPDMEAIISQWLAGRRDEEILQRIIRLIWNACLMLGHGARPLPEMGFLDHCEITDSGGERTLLRTQLVLEAGLLVGVCAKDMSFMTVFPEPKEGFAAYFCETDAYRCLFEVLATPGSLELLLDLHTQKPRFIVAEVEARRLGMEPPGVGRILEQLSEVHMLDKVELELAQGVTNAYTIRESGLLIPLLLLARCMMQENDSYYVSYSNRKRPWLHSPKPEAEEKGEKA